MKKGQKEEESEEKPVEKEETEHKDKEEAAKEVDLRSIPSSPEVFVNFFLLYL